MNFLQLQQAVYRRVKLPDSPLAADVTRIKEFINQRYRRLLSKPGMERFRDTTLTFASVASQKKYGLPQAISKVKDVFDLTNQRRVWPKTVDWLRSTDPGLTATASLVENWIPLNGWGAELVEMTSTGTGLWVVSDNAGDVQKAYVETTRLGGVRAGTAVAAGTTVNGVTRVAIGTKTDHIEVVKFYLNTVAVGTVSLYDASVSGNIISQITPGRTQARYFMLQLYPTPSAAITLSVDCQRSLEDLVQDTEEPLFPEDFHDYLVHIACYDEWINRDDSRAAGELKQATDILSDLRHAVLTSPDELFVQRGPRGYGEGTSRLGAWFPVDH